MTEDELKHEESQRSESHQRNVILVFEATTGATWQWHPYGKRMYTSKKQENSSKMVGQVNTDKKMGKFCLRAVG